MLQLFVCGEGENTPILFKKCFHLCVTPCKLVSPQEKESQLVRVLLVLSFLTEAILALAFCKAALVGLPDLKQSEKDIDLLHREKAWLVLVKSLGSPMRQRGWCRFSIRPWVLFHCLYP